MLKIDTFCLTDEWKLQKPMYSIDNNLDLTQNIFFRVVQPPTVDLMTRSHPHNTHATAVQSSN